MSFGWWNKFCFFLFGSLKFFGSSPSKKKKRKMDWLPRLVSFGWWNKFCFFLFGSLKFLVLRPQKKKFLVIRHSLDPRLLRFKFLRFPFFFFFFFFTPFPQQVVLFIYGTWTVAATFDRSSVNSTFMHYSRTHKFHFLSIFSLKIGPTVLFTHLKIILLQYFQFSVSTK